MASKEASPQLREARRALDGLPGYKQIEDLVWEPNRKKWVLKCRLTCKGSALVPVETDWYIFIDDEYPWGEVKFNPSKSNSISVTFPHMSFIGMGGETKDPWHGGELCLDTTVYVLERRDVNDESYDPRLRLLWHLKRALKWLGLACDQALLASGDPYELPVFWYELNLGKMLVFSESRDSYSNWTNSAIKSGWFDCVALPASHLEKRISDPKIVLRFCSPEGIPVHAPSWGALVSELPRHVMMERGLWVLVPELPIREAWEVPNRWKDLQAFYEGKGFDLNEHLRVLFPHIRTGQRHVLLLGFPIPENVGEANHYIQWQAWEIPPLTNKFTPINGFRPNTAACDAQRDKIELSALSRSENGWIDTDNWHKDQISTRGSLSKSLQDKRVAILGAGAFGSLLSEQLVRNGVDNQVIVDSDFLEIGNLTRHSLGLGELGLLKSYAVSAALNHVSPHAVTAPVLDKFPPREQKNHETVKSCDLIIDCTASDSVLPKLESFSWGGQKLFASFSLGLDGKRMFCFVCSGINFPMEEFREKLRPWLIYEKKTLGVNHPREGTGCWNTVFPARIDDLQLFVSTAVKYLEYRLTQKDGAFHFTTFEQLYVKEEFQGIRRVDEPPK